MSLPDVISSLSKESTKVVFVHSIESQVGEVTAAADDVFLYVVAFQDSKGFSKAFEVLAKELSCKFVCKVNKVLQKFEDELTAYFEGRLKKFTVPIKPFGSDFQQAVWKQLQELPFGSTQSYGDLANDLGRPPSHSRAVGAACGANPLLIVVPCHRLVASGSVGGFSCGVDRKSKLIAHERNFT